MSADNGIYILITPLKQGLEYRVIYAQAIDNIRFVPSEDDEFDYSHGNPREIVQYFENAPRFETFKEAWQCAYELYDEIMNGDFPIVEYGISVLRLDKPFTWYVEQEKLQPKYNEE